MFNLKTVTTGAAALALLASATFAETVIRVQSVIPAQADEVTMLKDFAEDVAALTNGSLKIEVLPAGAVVGVSETLDANRVDHRADFDPCFGGIGRQFDMVWDFGCGQFANRLA